MVLVSWCVGVHVCVFLMGGGCPLWFGVGGGLVVCCLGALPIVGWWFGVLVWWCQRMCVLPGAAATWCDRCVGGSVIGGVCGVGVLVCWCVGVCGVLLGGGTPCGLVCL